MILRTYDASGPDRILVREQHFNDREQPTFERLFDETGHTDREFFYDEQHRPIEMVERSEEGESYRKTFTYRTGDELASEQLTIGGEVVREVIYREEDGVHYRINYDHGEEAERREEEVDGPTATLRYYDQGELAEIQRFTDREDGVRLMQVFAPNGEQLAHGEETFTASDDVLTSTRYVDGNLLESIDNTYDENGRLLRQVVGEYSEGIVEYTLDYRYDAQGNLIEREWREQNSGQLIGFEHNRFDSQGRLIETFGKMNGTALGSGGSGEEHWVYEWEE